MTQLQPGDFTGTVLFLDFSTGVSPENVKIVARTLPRMSLSSNNLILSGILDIPTLISENTPTIMKALKKKKLWKLVKEPIELLSLLDEVEQFVTKYIERKNKNIKIPKKHTSLFARIKNLVNSM
ncbi:8391_t:CDS:2 [Racocetra fulgida]|uniref:8391_t:CDS:1 n=1 Tax=Racocetra fulgida TaxID=60492 RepID=A0A9N9CZ77_9GLOM|nr:8391_t:CDS:2 [Racocetra fulgida]